MTIKRLEELKKIFSESQGSNIEIGELLTDLFQSLSNHAKEIKLSLAEIKHNQEVIYNQIEEIKNNLNPVYTIVNTDDD